MPSFALRPGSADGPAACLPRLARAKPARVRRAMAWRSSCAEKEHTWAIRAVIHSMLSGSASSPFAQASLSARLRSRDAAVHQVVDLAHDVQGTPTDAVQRRHNQDIAVLQPWRPPTSSVAGGNARNAGDIDVGVDVAIRDTGLDAGRGAGYRGSCRAGQVPGPCWCGCSRTSPWAVIRSGAG